MHDVDTSDRTNTQAAFEFLKEIEARKLKESGAEQMDDEDDAGNASDGKIVFKSRKRAAAGTTFNRSVALDRSLGDSVTEECDLEKPVFRGSKVLMPEYVIGQKVKNGSRQKANKATDDAEAGGKSKMLKLGHLFENEDDNEDEN